MKDYLDRCVDLTMEISGLNKRHVHRNISKLETCLFVLRVQETLLPHDKYLTSLNTMLHKFSEQIIEGKKELLIVEDCLRDQKITPDFFAVLIFLIVEMEKALNEMEGIVNYLEDLREIKAKKKPTKRYWFQS